MSGNSTGQPVGNIQGTRNLLAEEVIAFSQNEKYLAFEAAVESICKVAERVGRDSEASGAPLVSHHAELTPEAASHATFSLGLQGEANNGFIIALKGIRENRDVLSSTAIAVLSNTFVKATKDSSELIRTNRKLAAIYKISQENRLQALGRCVDEISAWLEANEHIIKGQNDGAQKWIELHGALGDLEGGIEAINQFVKRIANVGQGGTISGGQERPR